MPLMLENLPKNAAVVTWVLCLTIFGATAQGQLWPGRGRQPRLPDLSKLKDIEFQGELQNVRPQLLTSLNAVKQPMLIYVPPDAQVQMHGTADTSVLKPKSFVQFTATANAEGKVDSKLEALELFTPFAGGSYESAPAGTEGVIYGQVLKFRDNTLQIRTLPVPGTKRRIITAELSESPQINVSLADYRFATPGSKLHVKGKKYQENQIIAKDVDIELVKPLSFKKR